MNNAIEESRHPDHGIWEPRTGAQHHVHSKIMTWMALDRALHIAPLFGGDRFQDVWAEERDRIKSEVIEQGYHDASGTFAGHYGGSEVDATSLLMPIHGFLSPDDPRAQRTLKRVVNDLAEGVFLMRYRSSDGIGADEGGFVLCGFWLTEALALAGRLDDALEVFSNHLASANHLGLLAEEVDPPTGTALGNFPQAFSHLGLIQAASRLDLALRLRDEGIDRPPRLEFDFPIHR